MALSKTAKVLIVVIGALIILAVGLGVGIGLGTGSTRTGIWLEFFPKPPKGDALIYWEGNDESGWKKWSEILRQNLEDYSKVYRDESRSTLVNCDFKRPAQPGQICVVDYREFGACSPENYYGYNRYSPCVFLKQNKVLNWTPETYNSPDSLPANMSAELRNHIAALYPEQRNMTWLTCEGVTPADKEYIGPLSYIPRQGFPAYYFPYTGLKGYLSPLIAVKFEKPQTGVLINVRCKLWAKNIQLDADHQLGSVDFQLMMD